MNSLPELSVRSWGLTVENAQQLYQKASQLALENDALEAELLSVLQRKPVPAHSDPVLAIVQQEARKQALQDIQLALRPYERVSSRWQGQAGISAVQAGADRSFDSPHADVLPMVFELCMEKHQLGKELALVSRGGYVTGVGFSQVASLVLPTLHTQPLEELRWRMAQLPLMHRRMQGATELRVATDMKASASATHSDGTTLAHRCADQYGQGMVANGVVLRKVTTLHFTANTTPLPQLHVYAPNITKVVLGKYMPSELNHAIGCLSLLPSLRCLAVTDSSQALPLHQLTSVTHLIASLHLARGTTMPPSLRLLEGAEGALLPVACLRKELRDLQGLRLRHCTLNMQFIAGHSNDVVCPMWGKLLAGADDTCEVVVTCFESGTQDILYSNNVPAFVGLQCRVVRILMIRSSDSSTRRRDIPGVLQILGHMLPAATDMTLQLRCPSRLRVRDSHLMLEELVDAVRGRVVQPARVAVQMTAHDHEHEQFIEQLVALQVNACIA